MTNDEPNADELQPAQHGGDRDKDQLEWDEVPADPLPGSLGYETEEWERIPTSDENQVIFLPGNEEDLEDDAFVVLDRTDLCDLVTER